MQPFDTKEYCMRRSFLLCCLLALGLLLPGTAQAVESVSLKVGIGDPITADAGELGLKFKELVEKRTGGKVKVTLYPNCELGDETEMLHNVRRGVLDMTCVGVGNITPFSPGLGVLTFPYLFENDEMVVRGTTGPAMDMLNKLTIKQAGLRILAFSYTSFRHLTNSRRPVETLDDIKGMKIRVPSNKVFIETYKAWGASPVPMAWSETFTALQQGVLDGQCNPYVVNHSKKFEEIQSYLTELHYTYSLQPLVIGERHFKKLSPELQAILTEAGLEAQAHVLTWQNEHSGAAKKAMQDAGVKISTLKDEDKWREVAMNKVWPTLYEIVGGRQLVDDYLKLLRGK